MPNHVIVARARAKECEHRTLRAESGGYYLACCDCAQRWVALQLHGTDGTLDTEGTSQTRIAAHPGRWNWRDGRGGR